MNSSENWIKEALPTSLKKVPPVRQRKYSNLLDSLIELRATPLVGNKRAENYAFTWPKDSFLSRAIPGGVASLDEEEGYDYDLRLERFFNARISKNIIFWALGAEDIGMFEGPYCEETRWWIKRNIILSPVVLYVPEPEVILIADEQWHMSVVGGDSKVITMLEDEFDGPKQLKLNFLNWVNEGMVGFGDEGKEWAEKYPIKWCGWDEVEENA